MYFFLLLIIPCHAVNSSIDANDIFFPAYPMLRSLNLPKNLLELTTTSSTSIFLHLDAINSAGVHFHKKKTQFSVDWELL